VVFFATPHGVAMAQAPELVAAGVKVIDLAADFRMQDVAAFEKWYKLPHSCTDLLKEAAYGLPELNREAIRKARVVGNPGCYPTTMQLGFAPLLKAGVIDASHLIADCKSGVSGAGRKAELSLLFSEASDNFKAYGVSGHRHSPETIERLSHLTSDKVGLLFTPHLVPMIRGMHSTLYARLTKDIDNAALQACSKRPTRMSPSSTCCPSVRIPKPAPRALQHAAPGRASSGQWRHRGGAGGPGQPGQGRFRPGRAVHEPDVGLDETTGLQQVPVLP
jgi:N-acetyl-gamma-glutamyl-phosphate reductase